jgi:predicted enzyme related to lactoylglutathione lyase
MYMQRANLKAKNAVAPSAAASLSWPISGTHTFFYYHDLPAAIHFYQHVLGFEKVADFDWCAIIRLHGDSHLGLVNATRGSQRPVAGTNKGAVLSLFTDDLEVCLSRARRAGVVSATTIPVPGCEGRTREFRIFDPGGYTLEFFCWADGIGPFA